jgi:hypothetical protein
MYAHVNKGIIKKTEEFKRYGGTCLLSSSRITGRRISGQGQLGKIERPYLKNKLKQKGLET